MRMRIACLPDWSWANTAPNCFGRAHAVDKLLLDSDLHINVSGAGTFRFPLSAQDVAINIQVADRSDFGHFRRSESDICDAADERTHDTTIGNSWTLKANAVMFVDPKNPDEPDERFDKALQDVLSARRVVGGHRQASS